MFTSIIEIKYRKGFKVSGELCLDICWISHIEINIGGKVGYCYFCFVYFLILIVYVSCIEPIRENSFLVESRESPAVEVSTKLSPAEKMNICR